VDNKDERRRWGTDQRLEFIEFRLYWDGTINRSDITAQFGVSVPQASNDLSLYKELAGENLRYDSSSKRYEAASDFKPRLIKPNAERYLAQLKAIADHVVEPSETPISDVPNLGVMPIPHRRVDPEILRNIVRAVRRQRSISIEYQSLNDDRPEPIWREISPHAFSHDGLRWHVRAFCHLESTYKDFILSRCLAVGPMAEPKGHAENDTTWTTIFNVVLKPNPKLSSAQQRVIELDYGMSEGKSIVPVRMALLYYFDKRLRLDIAEAKDRPKETPVVIQNRKEYDAALARVAY
jgi:hypothetical protein